MCGNSQRDNADYIRIYDWQKRLEQGVKTVGVVVGQARPTIQQPEEYRRRFIEALERYFQTAPDQSASSMIVEAVNLEQAPESKVREQWRKNTSMRKGQDKTAMIGELTGVSYLSTPSHVSRVESR